MLNQGFGNGGAGPAQDFERLARQYWAAWGDALRGAVPGSGQDGAHAWQEAIDWWTRYAQGSRSGVNDALDRFNAQARDWYGQMQQVAAQFRCQDITGNIDIITITEAAVDVEHERVRQLHVERSTHAPVLCRAAIAGNRIKVESFIRDIARYALVDHVHRAANRITAKQQDRWPAQYFNALGSQSINRDRVVHGSIGGIQRTRSTTRTYYSMYLIYKQDDVTVFLQLIHNGLHPLFKLSPVLGTSDQGCEIQHHDAFVK